MDVATIIALFLIQTDLVAPTLRNSFLALISYQPTIGSVQWRNNSMKRYEWGSEFHESVHMKQTERLTDFCYLDASDYYLAATEARITRRKYLCNNDES